MWHKKIYWISGKSQEKDNGHTICLFKNVFSVWTKQFQTLIMNIYLEKLKCKNSIAWRPILIIAVRNLVSENATVLSKYAWSIITLLLVKLDHFVWGLVNIQMLFFFTYAVKTDFRYFISHWSPPAKTENDHCDPLGCILISVY